MYSRALCSKNLLLDASYRKHLAAESHLTGHRNAALDLLSAECRHHRAHHSDTSRRAVLRNRTLRNVNMDILLLKLLVSQSSQFWMSLDILICDSCRLLHHIAEVTCHSQNTLAPAYRTFDEKNLSAHSGPCKSGHYSWSLIALLLVMRCDRKSEVLAKMTCLQSL